MYIDYGIIVIKPDGVSIGIEELCEKEIKNRGIRILGKKKVQLTVGDVKKYFCYKFRDYSNYMTSGTVCAYFLGLPNDDIDEAIYFIKATIRREFRVDGSCLRNYIHGAHCGTEFFLQRKLFFREYEKKEYSSYGDMLVVPKKIKKQNIEYYIATLRKSGIKKYVMCFKYNDLVKTDLSIFECIKKNEIVATIHNLEMNGERICILVYGKAFVIKELVRAGENALLKSNSDSLLRVIDMERMFVDELYKLKPQSIEEYQRGVKSVCGIFEKIRNSLCEYGIFFEAMVVNRANMPIDEAEIRFEVALIAKLIPIFGSCDEKTIGFFGCGPNKFEKLIEFFK